MKISVSLFVTAPQSQIPEPITSEDLDEGTAFVSLKEKFPLADCY